MSPATRMRFGMSVCSSAPVACSLSVAGRQRDFDMVRIDNLRSASPDLHLARAESDSVCDQRRCLAAFRDNLQQRLGPNAAEWPPGPSPMTGMAQVSSTFDGAAAAPVACTGGAAASTSSTSARCRGFLQ